jgi:hypothetical protein
MNNSRNSKSICQEIRIEDLVRFLHPSTGKKEIGLVVEKKLVPLIRVDSDVVHIKYGIISRKELIWLSADKIYEMERLDV